MDADQQKIMTMTRHAAEQGSELVRRLLAFARRQQLEPARIDIARLSSSVDDLLAHTLGGLVQLEWRTDDDLWCAYADEAQLELALMKLIINARDAMPEGGEITISGENRKIGSDTDLRLPAGPYVLPRATPTGTAIAPAKLRQGPDPPS